jgi:hypothetical protein
MVKFFISSPLSSSLFSFSLTLLLVVPLTIDGSFVALDVAVVVAVAFFVFLLVSVLLRPPIDVKCFLFNFSETRFHEAFRILLYLDKF